MSILDDAIREHLELKRAHGADDAELKRLEDEAFGPPERPGQSDPFAEAPTEFLVAPGAGAEEQADEGGGRVPNIADLQEAPEAPKPQEQASPPEAPQADQPAEPEAPAEEEHPAGEHETIAEPGPSTEERHAIASQPTEIFDVEGQFEEAPPAAEAPADEELVEAEQGEPRLAPAPAEEEPADEFDEFFSEQRLSDELNQALEAPLPDEPGLVPAEDAAGFADPAEESLDEPGALEEQVELGGERRTERDSTSDFILPEQGEESEPAAPPAEEPPPASSSSHDDVLEDTPEFLEESPEDDELWFEQKPPKDIDFGD